MLENKEYKIVFDSNLRGHLKSEIEITVEAINLYAAIAEASVVLYTQISVRDFKYLCAGEIM